MARECLHRGHTVRIYVLKWAGPIPTDLDITVIPVKALFNHNKYRKFSEALALAFAKDPVDCVVGFNKMPGLDIYYAADSCYEEKARSQRGWLYRHMSRYKHFSAYESSVFSSESSTEIMSISDVQKPYFIQHYSTQENASIHYHRELPMTGLHPRMRLRSAVIKEKNLVSRILTN